MQNSKLDQQNGSKIQLDKNFQKELGLILIKIERLKKKKISTYIYFIVCMVIGIPIIVSQRDLFNDFDFTYGRINKLAGSLLAVTVGFVFFNVGFSKLKKFRREKQNAKLEKEKLHKILNQHQVEYSCNIEFGKKYHGIQEVIVKLKSKSDLLEDSTIKYQV